MRKNYGNMVDCQVKHSIFIDVITKLDTEVFTQKAGRLYPPISQLLSLEKRLALCTATIVISDEIPDYKQLERLFWDNVNHIYGTGFFADEPQWQPNIFIPIRVWESLLYPYIQFYKNYNPSFNIYDFLFITAAISAWRYIQPVNNIEKYVYQRLLLDKDGRYLDGYLLNYYYQWTSVITTPGLKYQDKNLYGFFIHQNEVVYNGVNTKILILVFSYEDVDSNIDEDEALYSMKNWADYVVLKYESNVVSPVETSIIGSNIQVNSDSIELVGQMISLFNFSIHPKTDTYNHRGFIVQPTYNDTIDSFLSSYRKNKGMPVRRGVGKFPAGQSKRDTLYHVHAPSCPRLFESGTNYGFSSRMNKISKLSNTKFEELHWEKSETGLKLKQSRLYGPETEKQLLNSLNSYFYRSIS